MARDPGGEAGAGCPLNAHRAGLPWLLYAIAFRRGGEEWTVVAPLAMLAFLMIVLRWSRVGSRAWTRVEHEGARVVG